MGCASVTFLKINVSRSVGFNHLKRIVYKLYTKPVTIPTIYADKNKRMFI